MYIHHQVVVPYEDHATIKYSNLMYLHITTT